MSSTLRQLRTTIPAGQSIDFIADANLYVAASTGNVSVTGTASNRIPSPVLLTAGFHWSAPLEGGQQQSIGLITFKNESTGQPAYIEVLTSNGAIDRDNIIGGSQIVEKSNVFRLNHNGVFNPTQTNAVFFGVPDGAAKRLALLRFGIQFPGYVAGGANVLFYLSRVYNITGTFQGGLISRNDVASPIGTAVVYIDMTAMTVVDRVWQQRIAVPAAGTDPFTPIMHDFTNGGTIEPIRSHVIALPSGFCLSCSNTSLQNMVLHAEWQEVN